MRLLKKPVSLLLSLIMILSVFTIIPATSASAESVQVFARKWVEAENVTGDYFSFTDLYSNFIICRVNPDFDETNFDVDDTSNVYNRTGDISLGNYNEIRLKEWNDGYSHLNFNTSTNGPAQGDGKIYLSTNGDNINFNTDGVKWYAYTWETFTAGSVDAEAPAYDVSEEHPYINGVKQHYVSGDRKFIAIEGTTDGHQNVMQVSDNELAVPYFEFEKISDNSYKLTKCNAQDANIVVPDTIPVSYPDNLFWGKNITVIAGGAFAGNTNLVSIEIGDNVNHIGSEMTGHSYDAANMLGAFEGCSSLETVKIGSAFNYAETHCFDGCSSLEEFTTTTLSDNDEDSYSGLEDIAADNSSLTVYCYHSSSVAKALANNDYIELGYLGDPVESIHTFNSENPDYFNWTWSGSGDDVSASLQMICTVCGLRVNKQATLSMIPFNSDAHNCSEPVPGYYKATAEFDNQSFSDDDNKSHTCTIPPKAHTPKTTGDYANLYELDTSSGGGMLRQKYECSVCGALYNGEWFAVSIHGRSSATCTAAGNYDYCTDNGGSYYRYLSENGYNHNNYKKVDGENDVIIPLDPAAHVLYAHQPKEPTLSEDGNTPYWSCSLCHKYFSDANGQNEIPENSWVLPKTAVAYVADDYYTESFYEAVQHADNGETLLTIDLLKDATLNYDSHVAATKYPTFKVKLNGHTLGVTTLYPDIYTVNTEGPDSYGVTTYTITHKHRWKAEWNDLNPVDRGTYWDVDVDCTCDYCGETQKIKATAQHDSSYTEIVDATCTKGGYKKSNFSAQLDNTVVNKSITWGVVNALGHILTEYPAHEPTLSDDGNSAYWSCSRCGKFFSDAEAQNEIRQNSWIIEKTAVAYFSRGENQDLWFGDIKSAVEASAAYGNTPILLLKNAEFEWDEKLIADDMTSFRVRLNRHILGITPPEGYKVNESIADGITTYSLEALPYTMYLAEDGNEKKAYDATPITSDFTVLTGGWYRVEGNVIMSHDLMIQGNVKIILTDGSVLSINDGIRLNDDQGPETAGTITFYRQSGNTQGKLNAISITADDFTLVGGELNIAESVTAHNDANISGGDLTVLTQYNFEHNALSAGGNVNISGGTVMLQGDSGIVAIGSTDSAVNITGGDITLHGKYTGVKSYHVNITGGDLTAVQEWEYSNAAIVGLTDITLSWSNNGDSIYAESYSCDVTLLKPFIDDDGEIYLPGTVSKNKIANKALYPARPHEHTYSAHFNWDGYECPNADLTCTQCDAPAVTVDATVTSSITTEATPYAEGVRTYTATAVYNDKTFTDTKEETIPKTSYFTKHSLTLAGDIGVNFYIDYLNAADVAAGKVRVDFVCNGKNYSVTVGTDTTEVEGRQLYKATCYVSAAEMKDDITATLYIDNVETCTDHYTVRKYADVILGGDFDQKDKDVVGAMLNYGAMAQKQFDHNIDDLANAGVTGYDLAVLTDAEIEALGSSLPNSTDTADALSDYGVKYYGCSLLLRSKTTLRFYFEKTDASKFDAANFKIGGNTVEVNNYGDGSRYVYIEVTNIAAPNLAATHKVAVGDVEIGNVSPLNYAKDVLSDADASADLKNVMTALYRFYEAAAKRF